jgi:hypothetical protein
LYVFYFNRCWNKTGDALHGIAWAFYELYHW